MFRTKQLASRYLKKTIDADDSRRKREELAVQIRKDKRDENINKRRQPVAQLTAFNDMTVSNDQKQRELQEKLNHLPKLVSDLFSADSAKQVSATTAFRKLLSIEKNPPIQQVIDAGVVPRLVQLLDVSSNPSLQFEAAWALTNIASGSSTQTMTVIHQGAIPHFVKLLKSETEDVREQAVWALGNIAGDSAQCRNLVLHQNALPPLLDLIRASRKMSMLRNATWTLSNFCRGKPQPDFAQVKDALPVLAQLINEQSDHEVLTDACWALSYLSDDTGTQNIKIQAVINVQVVPALVRLLNHSVPNVKTPALRTVGNIVTGDDIQTQTIINFGALSALRFLLIQSQKKAIKKEACWTISNITAGNHHQIQAVIDADLIPPLVAILEREDFDIQKEAAWAISNATSIGDEKQIAQLVGAQVIPPLVKLLEQKDPKMIMVALEGIENILKAGQKEALRSPTKLNPYTPLVEQCDGLEILNRMYNHANQDIAHKVQNLLPQFWEQDDDTTTNTSAMQQTSEGMQQYAFNQHIAPQQQQPLGFAQYNFGSR